MSFTPWREAAFLSKMIRVDVNERSSQNFTIKTDNEVHKNNPSIHAPILHKTDIKVSKCKEDSDGIKIDRKNVILSNKNKNLSTNDTDSFDKRLILRAMQKYCSIEFLRKHHLNGTEDLILKKRNKASILSAHTDWMGGGTNPDRRIDDILEVKNNCKTVLSPNKFNFKNKNHQNAGDGVDISKKVSLESCSSSSSKNKDSSNNYDRSNSNNNDNNNNNSSGGSSNKNNDNSSSINKNNNNANSNNNSSNSSSSSYSSSSSDTTNNNNNQYIKSDINEVSNQRLEDTFAVLYNRHCNGSRTIKPRITILLLHEDYPHELPVFGNQGSRSFELQNDLPLNEAPDVNFSENNINNNDDKNGNDDDNNCDNHDSKNNKYNHNNNNSGHSNGNHSEKNLKKGKTVNRDTNGEHRVICVFGAVRDAHDSEIMAAILGKESSHLKSEMK